MLGITLFTAGLGCAVLAFWACARKVLPRIRMWLALLGGLTAGLGMFAGLANWVAGLFGDIAGHAVAYGSITLVCGTVLVAELVHAINPRTKYKGHRWIHPILAFIGPALMLAFGGLFGEAVGWLQQGTQVAPDLASFFVTRGR